jgi:uncharacterized protein YheU (UPF0270 family)
MATVVPFHLLSSDILEGIIREFLYGSLESSEEPLCDLEESMYKVKQLLERGDLCVVVDEESEHCSIQQTNAALEKLSRQR